MQRLTIILHTDICLHSFLPSYFEKDIDSGIPKLTAEGRQAVDEELAEEGPHRQPEEAATEPATTEVEGKS